MPVTDKAMATIDQTRLRHTLIPSLCLEPTPGLRWGCPLVGFLPLAIFRGGRRLLPVEEHPMDTARSNMVLMVGMDSSKAINNQATVKATIMVGVRQRPTTMARLITTVGAHQAMGRKNLEAEATTVAVTEAAETLIPQVAMADTADTRGSVDDVPSPVINDVIMHAGDSDAVNHLLARVLLFLFFLSFSLIVILCVGVTDGVYEVECHLISSV
jgi:hypothetical protein